MSKMLIPILFALGTAFFWGCYGPTIGNAQAPRLDGKPLGPPDGWTPFKPYVFIGVAYLLISVVGGSVMMKVRGDSFNFAATVPGVDGITHFNTAKWGFLAGTLGALGALCLTTAMMTSRGNALLVMPIVFGGAVSVTAIVSIIKLRSHGPLEISPLLWCGIALTVVGVVLVAMNTPHGHASAKPKSSTEASESPHASVDQKDAESKPESTS